MPRGTIKEAARKNEGGKEEKKETDPERCRAFCIVEHTWAGVAFRLFERKKGSAITMTKEDDIRLTLRRFDLCWGNKHMVLCKAASKLEREEFPRREFWAAGFRFVENTLVPSSKRRGGAG